MIEIEARSYETKVGGANNSDQDFMLTNIK